MSARPFLDTNILIYALCPNDHRSAIAYSLLSAGGTVSIQSLNEFVSVARRKLDMSWREIRAAVLSIETLCPKPTAITLETHRKAMQIAERYGYSIFDSMILAAALEAECTKLYSEDMHNGQIIGGLSICNPFYHHCQTNVSCH